MPIYPARGGDCQTASTCHHLDRCRHIQVPLLYLLDVRPATHFVGFRDPQQYENAARIFGPPDVVHHVWDQRAQREIAPAIDTVVFARYHPDDPPSPYNYDDSNESDDPAAKERLR
jgi:hypothetical protein